MIHAGRADGHGAALRHLRLLRVAGHRGGVPEHGAPGRRPRQGRHAGRRGRHRRPRSPTARPTCCPSATAAAVRALAAARPAGPSLARARLLPGLGPAPRSAADPLRRHLRLLPRRLPSRLRPAAGVCGPGGFGRTSTSRRPLSPWPASYCGAVECGAVDDAEVADKGGLDRAALARLARRTTPP